MALPPHRSRRSWLELISLVLAAALITLGAGSLAGWWLHLDSLIQPLIAFAPITANEAMCVLLLGGALLGLELRWFPPAWCALPAIVLTALTLGEYALSADFGIDELLVRDHLMVDTASPGRMSLIAACSLLLVAGAFIWRSINRVARAQAFIGGVAGSIVAAVGSSTLLGYAADVPAVYSWGTTTAISPVGGLALLLLGFALVGLSWREAVKAERATPSWSPIPVATGCLTLSVILWIGLRAREHGYISSKTQTSMEALATTINYQLDREKSIVERLASDWSNEPLDAGVDWEVDARPRMEELTQVGGMSVAWVATNFHTVWVFPKKDNESGLDFDHRLDEERFAALTKAQREKATVISGTIDLGSQGSGLVIYAPVFRNGRIGGFVAAEFPYRPFFTAVVAQRKLAADYRIAVAIGSDRVFDSAPGATLRNPNLTLDKAYPIADRRIRLSFTPSDAALASDRRLLPELALMAGFGITLLLVLSIHLARRARTGQRAAELSNRRLIAENEERRRIEDRLKVSDERLRLALDSTQIGIFEWNVAAGHVYYSPGLWAMLGYEYNRMPATVEAWQSLIHPDDLPRYRERAAQLQGKVTFIDPEYRVRSETGEWRWVYTRAKTVASDAAGQPARIVGTVQDITGRRDTELALRESQAEARKLSLVASKTDNPVLIGSPEGVIEWVNESFCRVMEYSLSEVIGRNPADFMVGPETNPRSVVRIRAAMARGHGLSTDVVNYSKSGRKYHLHLEIQPVRNDAGQLENFIAIETDITARVETEAQLRLAKAEADAASRAKSEFLASMSHEIRTPMNGVIGMTSLLMESSLTAEQRDFVNTIRVSGDALLTIINDILDFSKIESGKMDLEQLPFELVSCIEETLDLFALQASGKQIELVYSVAPEVPTWILGDVTRLRQILVNLVNNAVKFTPRGSVAIEVRTRGLIAAGPALVLEFTVRDTGIGIPPDRVDRLFKAFSQGDSSTTRKYGGTGLGLVISQSLATLMGGNIGIKSTVGQGSSFTFTIRTQPAVMPMGNAGAELLHSSLRAGPVLCVEDHPVTRQRLITLLESLGATCVFAPDPSAALLLMATLPQPPSLLVVDGDESAGSAPLAALLAVKIPRLLMVPFGEASPTPVTGDPLLVAVHKPVKTSALLHALKTLGNPTAGLAGAPDAESAAGLLLAHEIPLNVLLAEDNTVNQKVALRFLERLGYRADAVGNGLEVITALGTRQYDVVLMDLQMPEMDGLEASRQIRRLFPSERQPKIVALTANAMQGDRELCLAAGMDDYITKPVKLHEIAAAFRRLFSQPAPKSESTRVIG